MIRDVKNICTREYLRIKPATGRKWILKMDTHGYEYFWYPYVNGAGTDIIVSVPVDTRIR